MFDQVVREELMKMLFWQIGISTSFQKNPGLFGKYFKKYLRPDHWELLLATYSDAEIEHTWQSLFSICHLFRESALLVADHFSFHYPMEDDQNVTKHLLHVKTLSPDAKTIY
jgi:aminoglycoside 6-adenylyltransferase